jgi:hypothetical protein
MYTPFMNMNTRMPIFLVALCFWGLCCVPFTATAQTNVIHFSPDDYHAAGQNWSIMEFPYGNKLPLWIIGFL